MSEVNVDQLKMVCECYEAVEAELESLRVRQNQLNLQRSDCVRQMLEANGGKKKLLRKGKVLTIVIRGDNHFLRGVKEGDMTEI